MILLETAAFIGMFLIALIGGSYLYFVISTSNYLIIKESELISKSS